MAGYFSREERERRRANRQARRQDKERVKVAKLRLVESKQVAALAKTRRSLVPLAAAGMPDRPRHAPTVGMWAGPIDELRADDDPHTDPSHHVGPCGPACRAGKQVHYHRR